MSDDLKLKIVVDEDECIGDSLCCSEAPGTFEMEDDVAKVCSPITDDRETIIEAAKACPVDAITIVDQETGEQLVPEG